MTIRMDKIKVREICVANEWYNRGSLFEYSCMLDMCDFNILQTEESIKKIARNIFEHSSNLDNSLFIDDIAINDIAFLLLNNCCHFFFS